MKNENPDFEKKLGEYLRANPDIMESVMENDLDKLKLPDAWNKEVEKNNTHQKRLIAHNMAVKAMQTVKKKKKQRKIIARTAFAVAACLVLFLTVTPPGQALARDIIRTVVTIFEGNIKIETTGIDSVSRRIENLEYKEFTDIDEAAKYAGKALIYLDNTNATINSISVEAMEGINISITTEYGLTDGGIFTTLQRMYETSNNNIFDLNADYEYFEHELFNGQTMYCISYDDGTFGAVSTWDNTELNIISENVSWDELIKYIDEFTIIN